MNTQQISPKSADDRVVLERCWEDIVRLSHDLDNLPEIFARAEKLVQYCRLQVGDQNVAWLRENVERRERIHAAALASDTNNVDSKRIHAALTGALAGFLYPLGWSPRDLNHMAF
jgi:hypothetical protein